MSQFQTLKSDLTQSRIVDSNAVSIHDGEIAVRIESYAFTANNVTYGVAGDTIGYWKFFPAENNAENKWGCIPMWGFAEITHSKLEGLSVGERLFGYFPAADSLILSPIKVSDQSFSDGKEHRKELPLFTIIMSGFNGDQNYDLIHGCSQSPFISTSYYGILFVRLFSRRFISWSISDNYCQCLKQNSNWSGSRFS